MYNKGKKLFVYSKPNMMDGYKRIAKPDLEDCHRYTDDVAICYADSIETAFKIFSQEYSPELLKGHIREAKFNNDGIYICTDY